MTASNYQLVVKPVQAPLRPKSSAPKIREATFDDYPAIAKLESRYGLIPKNYDEWKHLWANNPVYYEFRHWPIGWVCEDQYGEIIGSIGNIPLAYEFDNRPVITATSRGLVADSGYRPYSFSLLAQFFGQPNVELFLNTSVNDRALRLQEMFRASRVPTGTWDESAFWITNYAGFARSALTTRELWSGAAFRFPVAAGLFCWDKIRSQDPRPRRAGLQPQFCKKINTDFDAFWEKIRRKGSARLLAVRRREILDWHFGPALADGTAWVVVVRDDAGISAYAVFRRQDSPEAGLRRMRLVDFQAVEDGADSLRAILAAALSRCREEGIDMLETIGLASEKRQVIESMNPHYRKLSAWRYFYKATADSLAGRLKLPEVWDPSCFDGDSSL
jgi:hypothetical protein